MMTSSSLSLTLLDVSVRLSVVLITASVVMLRDDDCPRPADDVQFSAPGLALLLLVVDAVCVFDAFL